MRITITEKEYEAIKEVLSQVSTDYQGASDDNYLESTDTSISLVYNVIKKYRKARQEANLYSTVRAEVSRKNRCYGLVYYEIDRITRQVIKGMRERGEI